LDDLTLAMTRGGPGGGGGAAPPPPDPQFTGPVTLVLNNAILTGNVDASGQVNLTGTQNIEVQIEGETIQKTARTGSFKQGTARESRTGRAA
jgi:hypothetical protein